VPRLSAYGFKEESIPKIIAHTSHKFHPVELSEEQMRDSLLSRM
jgi:hypothetical protein